jgi:hypothetical protein
VSTDIFGQVTLATQLERAVLATLEDWFPVYIREVELQSQANQYGDDIPTDALPLPRAFLTTEKIDRESADQLPCIVVVSPGLSGKNAPKQNGDGTFRVPWGISIGTFVSSNDRSNTKQLVRQYIAIARMIMLQKQSLGGFADGTTWLDESYDDNFAFVDQKTVGAGSVIFEVWVDNVVQRYGGPAVFGGPPPAPDPDTQPGSDWPVADTVTAEISTLED